MRGLRPIRATRRNQSAHGDMIVTTPFEEISAASSADLLEIVQTKRRNGYGAFWLSSEENEFPVLFVGIKKGLAWLNYLDQSDLPGYLSNGSYGGEQDDIEFMDMDGNVDLRPATCVVSEDAALEAVAQFFKERDRPTNIQWLEL